MLGLLKAKLYVVGGGLGIASPAGLVALPLALFDESFDRTTLREVVPSGLVYGAPFAWLGPRGSGDPRWSRSPAGGRGSCGSRCPSWCRGPRGHGGPRRGPSGSTCGCEPSVGARPALLPAVGLLSRPMGGALGRLDRSGLALPSLLLFPLVGAGRTWLVSGGAGSMPRPGLRSLGALIGQREELRSGLDLVRT